MQKKRFSWLVKGLLFLLALLQLRLFALAVSGLGSAAAAHGVVTLNLDSGRGTIFDRSMRPLTGVNEKVFALALPGQKSYARLYQLLAPVSAAALYESAPAGPTLVELEPQAMGAAQLEQIPVYTVPARYYITPVAVHVLGYLDGDGVGAAGIEKSYESVLAGAGEQRTLQCAVTGYGSLVQNTTPEEITQSGSGLGVQLTLDLSVQRICEGAAEQLASGAVVVMEVETGRLLGVASVPTFNPNNVARSIEQQDGALLCRAFAAYNVGSVFKPVVAAAALEAGCDPNAVYECTGEIEVAGHTYHCSRNTAHGPVNMQTALEESCNCYFVQLAGQIGGEAICQMASRCGFGRTSELWAGYSPVSGTLPSAQDLLLPGETATLGFGQGKLTATPVQLAAFYNTLAANGIYRSATLVSGVVQAETGELVSGQPVQEELRVMNQSTAQNLRQMLVAVVAQGLGQSGASEYEEAAGKTGTAQTGRMNEERQEELDAWFAGFWPAQQPRYTIVVLEDSTRKSGEDMGSVFSQVCDELARLEMWGTQ